MLRITTYGINVVPIPRLYQSQDLQKGITIVLDPRAQHHIVNVLRLRDGAALIVFNDNNGQFTAVLKRSGKKFSAQLLEQLPGINESANKLILAQSVSRGDRMDLTIQKAVELGVKVIQPLLSERSQKLPTTERINNKMKHWQGIIISACEQSDRCLIPLLHKPQKLAEYLANRDKTDSAFVLNPNADSSLTHALNSEVSSIELLCGPEGGFSDQEVKLADAAGFKSVSLGPRVLRTESAGIVALSICQAIAGDLK